MRKRFLSLNLVLLMLFTMLPFGVIPASAADSDNGYAVYYKNDGTDESISDTVGVFLTSNAALKLYEAMPAFSAEDKAVTSYNSAADGGGTPYALSSTLGESYTTDADAPGTLYAQWEEAPGNHILYISTDGLSAGGKDYVLDSSLSGTVTLRGEDTFSPAGGGKVIGWSTTPRYYGDNDVYTINSDVEIFGDLTLYSISGVNYITFHYDEYDYTSSQPTPVETTRFYQQNDDLIDSYNIERSIYVDNGIFVGWNEREDGTGNWYNSDGEAAAAPNDLYAQYETYPSEGEYCVLTTSSHPFANGQQSMILPLTDGKATLPQTLADGKIAAYYWSWGTGSGEIYYPSGTEVEIEHRANLTAVTVNPSSYYGIIDGDGGQTASGSKYSATSCFVTSAGNLNIYSFNDVATFTKDGQAVSGYKGNKTGAVYGVDDDIWAAMGTEAEANQIANFTAQYQTVTGGYVQYFGNGAQTSGGASYIIQDGLDFAALGGATFAANPFVAPAGQSFIGWNTQADGSGDWYDAGNAITLGENTVLYAQWEENRITYHFYDFLGDSTITEVDEETVSSSISLESDAFDGLIEKTANQYRLLQYVSLGRLGDLVTRLDAIKLIVALGGMSVDTSGSVTLPFDDCDHLSNQEKAIVKAALDAGLTLGTGQNRFDPDIMLTRANMANLIWRTIGEPSASVTETYSDVEVSSWFYEPVTTLLNLGILPSETDTFSPDDPLTGRDALRWVITAYEWKQDGTVKNSELLSDNYDQLLFEGWNTFPDGSGTWYCAGSDIPAGSVLHLYESWILPPASGYYYVLLAPKLDNGRMVKVVTMTAETESVTLPNSGQLGWASGTVQEAGFLDNESSIHLPGSTVETTSGTQFRSLKPYTYAEFHENYSGHQEQRVYYNLVSNGRLSLYGPSDVFSDIPTDVTFKHWNTAANGSGTAYTEGQNLSDGTYLLYAQWQSSGQPTTPPVNPGGGDDGGGSGGGGYAPSTPSTPSTQSVTVPISGEDNTIHVGATVKGDTATIDNVDLSQLNTVIGNHVEKIAAVTIDFSGLDKDISTVTLPADVIKQIADAVNDPNNDAQSLLIVLSDGTSIEFDAVALGEKSTQADGQDITISIKPSKDAKPNRKQEEAIKDRPAYDITVTSGGKHIDYMGGMITIHAPYELQDGEHPRGIVVWYVDEDGKKERCETSYDSIKKCVNWKTDHLSLYMIDYDPDYIANCPKDETCPMYPFADLDVGAWHHDGVHYAIETALMKGTSTTEMLFSPDGITTRAQIVTILHRLEGSPINGQGKSGTFVDVPEYQWYTEAVEWAAASGITSGTGDGTTFSPNAPITREQLATFLYRYAQHKGYDVSVDEDTNILSYEDAFTVSEYAIPAMQWACGAGIIGGIEKDGTMYLDPQGNAIRAQAATMLMRFSEKVNP